MVANLFLPADLQRMSIPEVLQRVEYLRQMHVRPAVSRNRVRSVLDGGTAGVRALLGDAVSEIDDLVPVPPLLNTAIKRLAQKIGGAVPDLKIDPYGYKKGDTDTAKAAAEKRERIIDSYDRGCRLELQLPQVGRWLPGYGFAVWVIKDGFDADGSPYPYAQLRDPYDCYPGAWTVDQQPQELACVMKIPVTEIVRQYPHREAEIRARLESKRPRTATGAILLSNIGTSSWANPGGDGVDVVEYWVREGTYIVVPDWEMQLDFIPNPLAPHNRFVVAKRMSFNALTGHYDHTLGLLASMTRISILEYIHLEDSVFTETNVYGESLEGDVYRKGRNAVNRFVSGSKVDKPINNLPYQLFQGIDRIERMFRGGASYPVTDDAVSPNSWLTGRGLTELRSDVDNEVKEYQKVLRYAVQDLDSKRLEWDERRNAGVSRALVGYRQGQTYSETYDPGKDIDGRYTTRRVFGIMAGWDEPGKIVAGLQLQQGEVIDVETFQENLDGLENITQVNQRIRRKKAEETAWGMLQQAASTPDPMDPSKQARAQKAVVEIMDRPDHFEEILKRYYTEAQDLSEEEQAFLEGPQAPELPFGPETPDVTTVLSRLEGGGEIGAGVQTVGRM